MVLTSAPTVTIDDIRSTVGANVRRVRARRYAQEALALEAGLDRTMVSKIERGVTSPSLETLLKIANTLGVGVHDLLRPVPVADETSTATGRSRA